MKKERRLLQEGHMGVSVGFPVLLFLMAPQEHVLMLIFYTIITYHALISCSIIIFKKEDFIHSLSKKRILWKRKMKTKKLEEEE